MPGGWLADRFSKRQITIWTKVMEIGSMAGGDRRAGAAFAWTISLVALTLVATQAALFGPSKYGLLPELLPAKRLSWGNGVIELGTFLAIIVGTVTGAAMAESFRGHEIYAGYALLALAFVGLLTSFGIDQVPPAAPEKKFRLNFLGDLWQQIKSMRKDRALFLAVAGNTYFWVLGSLLFSTIVVYGPDVLHIGQTKTGYLNAMLAVGIGIGSMVAGLVSGNKIEYGLIPLGCYRHDVHRAAARRIAARHGWDRRCCSASLASGLVSLPCRSTHSSSIARRKKTRAASSPLQIFSPSWE